MNIKDLLIKKEYGFSESFSRNMTKGVNGRCKLIDLEDNQVDIADWANNKCFEKCGIEPQETLEDVTCCDCCRQCDIPMIYLSLVKLGMIEEVLEYDKNKYEKVKG